MNETAKAVVTVIGKDMVGILSKVSTACADANANVIEVTQSVLDSFFCMVMIIDITEATKQIDQLQKAIEAEVPAMQVHVMHENIFNSMHRDLTKEKGRIAMLNMSDIMETITMIQEENLDIRTITMGDLPDRLRRQRYRQIL